MISLVFVLKNISLNMDLVLNGYGAVGFFLNYYKCAPVNHASNGRYVLHNLRKPLILPLKGR